MPPYLLETRAASTVPLMTFLAVKLFSSSFVFVFLVYARVVLHVGDFLAWFLFCPLVHSSCPVFPGAANSGPYLPLFREYIVVRAQVLVPSRTRQGSPIRTRGGVCVSTRRRRPLLRSTDSRLRQSLSSPTGSRTRNCFWESRALQSSCWLLIVSVVEWSFPGGHPGLD